MKDLIKIIFLGTGGYRPNERRQTVSVMIPSKGFVLDAGTGFFRAKKFLIDTKKLHIFLSHPHHDHMIGLTYYRDVLRNAGLREEDVTVYGLEKHLESIKAVLKTDSLDTHFNVNFQPIPLGRKFTVEGVAIEAKSFPHRKDVSVGYKFDFQGNKTLAYITDTTCSLDYIDFIKDIELLIHECYLSDDFEDFAKMTSHSWTSGVNKLAKKAGVNRLALIHLNPEYEIYDPTKQKEARIRFPRVIISQDLEEIDL